MLIVCSQPKSLLKEKLGRRHELAKFIVDYLYEKTTPYNSKDEPKVEEVLVEFSVHELKEAFEKR